MAQNLELRQSQSLVMTQRLQQSIKMLQLPAHELQELVLAEVEMNPLLAIAEPEAETPAVESDDGEKAEKSESEGDDLLDVEEESWWGAETESQSESRADRYDVSGPSGNSATEAIEARHSEEVSLKEHLRAQLGALVVTPAELLIGQHLIDLVDDAGYLTEDTHQIEQALGAEAEAIEAVIQKLQTMEPTGVFARSLTECMRLQLEERDDFDHLMERLFAHLDLLAAGDIVKLKKLSGLSDEELREAMAVLRTLNPKPGTAFGSQHVETLIPDVHIRKEQGKAGAVKGTGGLGWRVELNPDALPRVLFDRAYHSELVSRVKDKEEKKFVSEQFANASWLVKALDQRATNLLKISTEIVAWQKDFLERGIMYLKPMRLSDIAEKASVHESTVSRIVANKTMTTPRGLFEMRYFFTTGVGGEDGGDALSSRAIMHEIQRLIAAEKGPAILSDDAIARILKDRGMDVARRTVVKYRQILDIPSSVERRRALAAPARV